MPVHTHVSLADAFGIQHAQDEYWFRPLILGDNLFTYVAHIPPGGGVPPYPEAAKRKQIEYALYLLQGQLKVSVRGRSVTLVPHTAFHIPAGEAVEMFNGGEITATLYMAYTPSPWGPSSPYEDRKAVTSLAEMRAWYQERGHRIWSAEEMNTMAGDLVHRHSNLAELDRVYQASQENLAPRESKPWLALWDAEGYRHGHAPHPPDDFWFRPLVSGSKQVTYIGLIPVNGGVPPSPEEAAVVEMSVFTLGGELGFIVLDSDGGEKERFVVQPHQAVYAPLEVPIGFWNPGNETASFALSFTPTRPGRETIPNFRKWAVNDAGWEVVSPEILNEMAGDTLWDSEIK